jgi:hypothetical protein
LLFTFRKLFVASDRSVARPIDPISSGHHHRTKDPSDKGKLEAIRGRKATGLDEVRRDSRVAEEDRAVFPRTGGFTPREEPPVRARLFAALLLSLSATLLIGPQWGPQAHAIAPVTFQGTVSSAATGTGLPGFITIAGPVGWSGQTDGSGRYSVTLQAVSGDYTVTAASPGYLSQSRSVPVRLDSPAGTSLSLAFALVPATPPSAPAPPPAPPLAPAPSPTPAPAPTAGPGVYNIPPSIPADCSRDVAADIASWIASVPDNATLVFAADACYRTERQIRMNGRVGLTFAGNGALFRRFELSPPELQWPVGNRHFLWSGGRNITVRNMRIQGINTTSDDPTGFPGFGSYRRAMEFEHALSFSGVQGVTIEDVSIDAVFGDGIYFGGEPANTNVRISRVTIDRNGRQGIGLTNVDGALLDGVTLLHSRRSGFDFEPNPGWAVRNVEVRNSYTFSRLLPFAAGGLGQVSGIYLHHNTIDGASVPWVYVGASDGTRRRDWRIYDNRVLRDLGSPMPMLYFVNVDNVDVRRNISHASRSRGMTAVEFRNSGSPLYLIDNDFTGACTVFTADATTAAVTASNNLYTRCATEPK